jgi:hypothetical protein
MKMGHQWQDWYAGPMGVGKKWWECSACGARNYAEERPEPGECRRGLPTELTVGELAGGTDSLPSPRLPSLRPWPSLQRLCPSPQRVMAIIEHMLSLGAYTQAEEVYSLLLELQRMQAEKEKSTCPKT